MNPVAGDELYVAIVVTTDTKAIPEPRMTTSLNISCWQRGYWMSGISTCKAKLFATGSIRATASFRSTEVRVGLQRAIVSGAPGDARNAIRAIRLACHPVPV